MKYTYLQVKHTANEGDIIGQALTFDSVDKYLLEYHTQMKNAINNANVLGMSIKVVDIQLNEVFSEQWVREAAEPEQTQNTQTTEQPQGE